MGVPEAHARAARRRLERAAEAGETVLVSDLVITEAYHALQHHYGVPKGEARSLLLRLVESHAVQLDPPAGRAALPAAGVAGLVDRPIHLRDRSHDGGTVPDERTAVKV